jgi:hypothetical protein
LRNHDRAIDSVKRSEGELANLLEQARAARAELERDRALVASCWDGRARVGGRPRQINAADVPGISMEIEMLAEELARLLASQDLLMRGSCQSCGRPFLARKSSRERKFCSDRCRVRAYRARK